MAENLELCRDEAANSKHQMTGRTTDDCRKEVDLSTQSLFHWGAFCDKYGGTVQVDFLRNSLYVLFANNCTH